MEAISPEPEFTEESSPDPTGLDDLENLVLRLEQGERLSLSESESAEAGEEDNSPAKLVHDCLMAVINDKGHSIVNGIIVLRTAEKVLDAWNALARTNNFERDAYQKAAMRVVSAMTNFDPTSVYHSTGLAFSKMLDNVDSSARDLSEIKSGVDAVCDRINTALEFERRQNGKTDQIQRITQKLIIIERDFRMHEIVEHAPPPATNGTAQPAATSTPKRAKASAPEWTDEQRVEVLRIYRDHPNLQSTHRERAAIFNSRFPRIQRTREGIRQEHTRLVNQGITIAQLEAKLNRSS